MLTPTFDRMFDRGLLTFGDNGDVYVSPSLSRDVIDRIGLDTHSNVGSFRSEQQGYLDYHREHVFQRLPA
jgi:hypothetical protein